ncbi:MAG: phosphoribosylglycinamide formyltransferase [Defluviitaleaceae bacterium]|nr:phosphoribosylglycinamide formyltransferase [Defluviitaleaceae bacterium]
MFRIAALVSGGGTNLQAVLDAISAGKIPNTRVELVVSTNGQAFALERAKKAGIEAVVLEKSNFPDLEARETVLLSVLSDKNIDLVVFCGCLMILSEKFIEDWDKPIINIHPSLLPAYGGKGFHGLAVHEAVLSARETETGATVHYVDGGIDTGRIILQKKINVQPDDTAEILQKRVMEEAEWQILPEVIARFVKGELP